MSNKDNVVPMDSRRSSQPNSKEREVREASHELARRIELQIEKAPDDICRLIFRLYKGEYHGRHTSTEQLCRMLMRNGAVDKMVVKNASFRLGVVMAGLTTAQALGRIQILTHRGRIQVRLSDQEHERQFESNRRSRRDHPAHPRPRAVNG